MSRLMKSNGIATAKKITLAVAIALLYTSSAQADNGIYIGTGNSNANSNSSIDGLNALTIMQAGASVNTIGESASSRFNVDGKWQSMTIYQGSGGTASNAPAVEQVGAAGDLNYVPGRNAIGGTGNKITGAVKNNSTGTGNTLTLAQWGNGNAIALAVGATTASTTATVIGVSQTGVSNSSTYAMNHTGDITVAEATQGDRNIVAVTSSGGTNYSNTINLMGNENKVTVNRSGAFTTNTDSISLTGNLNTVLLNGTAGGSNAVTLASTGSNNVFGITQSGAGTMADINVATSYKNFNVTQATAGAKFALAGTLANGGAVSITH